MTDSAAGLGIAQYETLLGAAEDMVFLLDGEQRYVGVWGRWITEHGVEVSDFLGKTSGEVFGAQNRDFYESMHVRVLAGESLSYEQWVDTTWGKHVYYRTTLSPMLGEDGAVLGIVGVSHDVTDLKQARDRLEHMAFHDSLTDLPNRASFKHAVERATAKAERGTASALMFVDVDNFKSCNDVGGHALGDTVLAEVGHVLREHVREPDIVARVGGDEFGVLLEAVTPSQAVERAEQLAMAVHRLGRAHGLDIDLSVGIVAVVPGLGFDAALAGADSAMYRAKESGERVFLAS